MSEDCNILFFDIENAPAKAYIWQRKNYYINPRMIFEEWYMLSWSAKWLGKSKMYCSALCDYKGYNHKKPDDSKLMDELWELLDKADIVIAHNAPFDCTKSNTRFLFNKKSPPSPYTVIDTCSVARREFRFMSNSLNELARFLGIGQKERTGGFDLWEDCMQGDMKAWEKMKKYNRGDVRLLEKVYLKMRPYMRNHPNLSVYGTSNKPTCPKCRSTQLAKNGFRYTQSGKYQRFHCKRCHSPGRFKVNEYLKTTDTTARTTN